MPSRVIRGGFNSSESMAQRSLLAELMFAKLLLAVDDYGRLDARPMILRGLLYPMRDNVSHADVESWLSELTSGEDPPVVLYEIEGKSYLYLPNWEVHRGKSKRGKLSRWPDPPRGSAGIRGAPKGSARGSEVAGSRGSEESGSRGSEETTQKVKPAPPALCVGVAEALRSGILKVQPNRNLKPNFIEQTARVYDLAIRIDNRTCSDLHDQIDWLFGLGNQSAEAMFEVFSGAKHRRKFDDIERMMARPNRSNGRPPRESKSDELDRLAEEFIREDRIAHGLDPESGEL